MPHMIREYHLDDLCANCKTPIDTSKSRIINQHSKTYLEITCGNCNYKTIKLQSETTINDRFQLSNIKHVK